MRVLVTGHQGYIGRVMTPMLIDAGFNVTGLDANLFTSALISEEQSSIPSIEMDIRDTQASTFVGFDAVIHLAGLSNDPLGELNPSVTNDINHHGAVHVAEQAKKAGVPRFVFASTCSNYGVSGSDWLTESAPLHPITAYARAKVDAENAIHELASDVFSPTVLRLATAYGASPALRFDLVVNNLVAWAIATGEILLKSDGTSWRPLVHVEDIALAFIAVLATPTSRVHNMAFNVGRNDDNFQVRDIARLVKAQVPECEIVLSPAAQKDPRSYRVDCRAFASRVRAFQPRWCVATGVRQLLDVIGSRAIPASEFEGIRYQRVAHLIHLIRDKQLDADLRRVR